MLFTLRQLREAKFAIEKTSVLRECQPDFLVAFLAELLLLRAKVACTLRVEALLAKIMQFLDSHAVCVGALAVLVQLDADALYDGVVCSNVFAQLCLAVQRRWQRGNVCAFVTALVVAQARSRRRSEPGEAGKASAEEARGMMCVMRSSALRVVQEMSTAYFVTACL